MGRARNRHGMTLVEIMIALAVMTVIVGAIANTMWHGNRTMNKQSLTGYLNVRAKQMLDEMVGELRNANLATLAIVSTDEITFEKNEGLAGTVILWSDPITYRFDPSPYDPTNGDDDDNNGVVDDGRLVREQNGVENVIGGYVAGPNGLVFTLDGNQLTIELYLAEETQTEVREGEATVTITIMNDE